MKAARDRRPAYPLPQEYVVMLETLVAIGLQQNPPVAAGIRELSVRLKLRGPYAIRLKATFEPTTGPEDNAT